LFHSRRSGEVFHGQDNGALASPTTGDARAFIQTIDNPEDGDHYENLDGFYKFLRPFSHWLAND
jgi:hypothetical protein